MIDHFSRAMFVEHVGATFQVADDPAHPCALTLTEVTAGMRTPRQEIFSLLFRGPAEHLMPQGIRRLAHERLGVMELFLAPIGLDDAGYIYEAAFNLLIE